MSSRQARQIKVEREAAQHRQDDLILADSHRPDADLLIREVAGQIRGARRMARRNRRFRLTLLVILAMAVGALGTVALYEVTSPDCSPSEDSCLLDYRDGTWYITEVTP